MHTTPAHPARRLAPHAAALAALALVALAFARAQPDPPAPRIASIDLFACVEAVIETPAYANPRVDESNRWTRRLAAIETEMNTAAAQLETLAQNDPTRQAITARLAALQRDYLNTRDQAAATTEAIAARQAAEIDTAVRAIATEIAAERGYSHLVASRAPETNIDPSAVNTIRAATQQILARPLLLAPKEHDLTDATLTRLRERGLLVQDPQIDPDAPRVP